MRSAGDHGAPPRSCLDEILFPEDETRIREPQYDGKKALRTDRW